MQLHQYEDPHTMIDFECWEDTLSKVTGVTLRGVERVSTAHCLDLLEVDPDPVLRQRVAKRLKRSPARAPALDFPVFWEM
jgi:hypothetical protein